MLILQLQNSCYEGEAHEELGADTRMKVSFTSQNLRLSTTILYLTTMGKNCIDKQFWDNASWSIGYEQAKIYIANHLTMFLTPREAV